MTGPARLYHLARADFLERVRRHGFLVALLFCIYAGYAFLPPNPSPYATLMMDGHRGIYNSAWVGTAVAMLSGAFISLIGFYVVKNAVERDRRTRVGQILATTPLSKVQYTLGKTLSNFAVLAAMTLVVAAACALMQQLRGEDRAFDAAGLFLPFLLLTMPVLMMTSAVAVLFETLPGLRGGIGNVAFVFMWGFLLGGSFDRDFSHTRNDPLGTGVAFPSMFSACADAFPDFSPAQAGVSMGVNVRSDGPWVLSTFRWDGVDWTPRVIGMRLSWIVAGLAIGAVAAIPFDRFDPARSRGGVGVPARRGPRRRDPEPDGTALPGVDAAWPDVHLTPLPAEARGVRLGGLVLAEWKLIMRGLRWWYVGPLAVAIASLAAPVSGLRAVVLPLAFFWPVLLWSKLGTRESLHHTEAILFSAPHPLARQLVATWIAGVMVSVVASGPVALRLLAAGDMPAVFAWAVGAAFVPALAIALGVWTHSGKAFEAIHTGLIYAILQSAVALDFMGATPAAVERGLPRVYALITVMLLAIALAGRRQRLRA